ncbi:MAG: putative lipid II flippase FtsW [Pseudomonadota bacterium]
MAASRINEKKSISSLFFLDPALDPWPTVIIILTLVLLAAGLVMVFSASMVRAMQQFAGPAYFFNRQMVFALIGLCAMIAAALVPVKLLRRLTGPLVIVSLIGLVVCLTSFGETVKGASRWISFGKVQFQPSELAKLAIIFFMAHSMAKKAEKIKTVTIGFLPHLLLALVFALLCIKEPDLGAAMMIMLLCMVMLFIGGTRLSYILFSAVPLAAAAAVVILKSGYRRQRMLAFLNPDWDPQGINFQIKNSLIGLGSGGFLGKGIGEGKQKLLFLPDAHTDFLASIIGEEMGFIGLLLIIIAFGMLVYAGIRIALKCRTLYTMCLASGITLFLGFQVAINLGVVMSLLPTKGMTLPFMSYGGSSLLCNLFAVGILLSISRQIAARDGPAQGERQDADRET